MPNNLLSKIVRPAAWMVQLSELLTGGVTADDCDDGVNAECI